MAERSTLSHGVSSSGCFPCRKSGRLLEDGPVALDGLEYTMPMSTGKIRVGRVRSLRRVSIKVMDESVRSDRRQLERISTEEFILIHR